MHLFWRVCPLIPPPVVRSCRRCGRSRFLSSGKFRVNAQRKTLDVWLIWQCEGCGQAWNMEIHSRVKRQALPPAQLNAFLENDPTLAFRCAFDTALHRRNGTRPCWEAVEFTVEGELPVLSPGGQAELTLRCEVPFPVRILAVFAQKLSLSMEALRLAVARGALQYAGNGDPIRQRLHGTQSCRLTASPCAEEGPLARHHPRGKGQ